MDQQTQVARLLVERNNLITENLDLVRTTRILAAWLSPVGADWVAFQDSAHAQAVEERQAESDAFFATWGAASA